MATRRSVWSDERVIERLKRFVPAADEVSRLQREEGLECTLFRQIAEQGHYAGRTQPSATRQGIYAAAPSGAFLASVNTRRVEGVLVMLDQALAAWDELPDEERWLEEGVAAGAPKWRFEDLWPEDGLALTVVSRDLVRVDSSHGDDWREHAWNLDHAWFRRDELATFVPAELRVGATVSVERGLVARLAALHLVDNVRGQVTVFADADVETAQLESEVVAIDGDRVELLLTGATRAVTRGSWAVRGFRDRNDPDEQTRGVELALRGRATWDAASGRFVRFDLVADGVRWGGTQYNARGDDLAEKPIAFVLSRAEDDDRIAPAVWWRYPWR